MNNKILLRGLKNIGSKIADRLEVIGLKTLGDLKKLGPAKAYLLLQEANLGKTLPVCYYLYSLQGALEDKHWNSLSENTKKKLLNQISSESLTKHSSRRAKARRLIRR